MMKSGILIAAVLAGFAACAPATVPTERGIGFDDPTNRALREAQLSTPRGTIVPGARVNSLPAQVPQVQANSALDPLRTRGLDASPSNPAPVLQAVVPAPATVPAANVPAATPGNSTDLSDEQNFDAVSGRETIESDAQRRAAQAAAREQINPTAVPNRPSNVGPDIVAYALAAPNVKGQEWYSRSLLSGEGRFRRNCAGYNNPDDAQRDFLARGGPDRDRRGIDPDGDGFACGWDPAPFVQAFGN